MSEPLLAGDRAALATLPHGREADSIHGTEIQPYRGPTPVPPEDASA